VVEAQPPHHPNVGSRGTHRLCTPAQLSLVGTHACACHTVLLYDSNGQAKRARRARALGRALAGCGAGGGVGRASGRARSEKRGHWGCWGRARVMWPLVSPTRRKRKISHFFHSTPLRDRLYGFTGSLCESLGHLLLQNVEPLSAPCVDVYRLITGHGCLLKHK